RTLRLTDSPSSGRSGLALHDALPISHGLPCLEFHIYVEPDATRRGQLSVVVTQVSAADFGIQVPRILVQDREVSSHQGDPDRLKDRKSTRLNSSHVKSSYAVFCLEKK